MDTVTEDREALRACALQLINDLRAAFNKGPLDRFTPCVTTEDYDCVIDEIIHGVAVKSSFTFSCDWSETDQQNRTWMNTYDYDPEPIAVAWKTEKRQLEDGTWEVIVPEPLADFATRAAVEGEYPELVLD